MITIELFGVPRLRAGKARVDCQAATVGEALVALAAECPALEGTVTEAGRIRPAYALSLNGDRFVTDPDLRLAPGDVLLLLSADVGG
jgi:molybdopterin synthase sulfur carrier subunit